MLNRSIVVLLVAAPLVMLPLSVAAQSMDLKTTPPSRERVAPSVPDRDLHPQRPALPDRPNFIAPLSKNTKSGARARRAGAPRTRRWARAWAGITTIPAGRAWASRSSGAVRSAPTSVARGRLSPRTARVWPRRATGAASG